MTWLAYAELRFLRAVLNRCVSASALCVLFFVFLHVSPSFSPFVSRSASFSSLSLSHSLLVVSRFRFLARVNVYFLCVAVPTSPGVPKQLTPETNKVAKTVGCACMCAPACI